MLMTLLCDYYRMITLSNGLTALLVEDPKTDKAAAAMSVGVGHLSDPVGSYKEYPPLLRGALTTSRRLDRMTCRGKFNFRRFAPSYPSL